LAGRSQTAHATGLPCLILAYCAASLLHFVHNAVYLHDYPNMPASLSAARIYAAWCGITAVGVVGYWLHRAGYRIVGLVVIAIYAALGFGGLNHYTLAPVFAHSLAMNLTIGLEALTAAALLIAVCALRPFGGSAPR
jgi:hypothetical protein